MCVCVCVCTCACASLIQCFITKYLAAEIFSWEICLCVCACGGDSVLHSCVPICRILKNILLVLHTSLICFSYMCIYIYVLPCSVHIFLFWASIWNDALLRKEKNAGINFASFYFCFAMEVIEKKGKNRWMGFTHHNRNLRLKQGGECSGFPGKTYRPLSNTFGGRLSSTVTCWAVPWLHVFVCSLGGPSGNQTHNHSLALQIKKCIYTLLSLETTSNQFWNIGRVECSEGLTEGHLGTVTLVSSTSILGSSRDAFTGRAGLSSVMSTCGNGQVLFSPHTAQ